MKGSVSYVGDFVLVVGGSLVIGIGVAVVSNLVCGFLVAAGMFMVSTALYQHNTER